MGKFIYEINGFMPPSEPGVGRCGFSAFLDKELAVRASQVKVSSEIQKGLLKFGSEAIRRVWERDFKESELCGEVYNFHEDSLLLQYCSVPGDRCILGMAPGILTTLQEGTFPDRVEYSTHNVDNPLQAYALLTLWLRWANGVNVFFDK